MGRKVVIGLITVYQATLSPDHGLLRFVVGGACRYTPTCSEYTKQAVAKYGVIHGIVLGLHRIGRCHPGRIGGFDPVP